MLVGCILTGAKNLIVWKGEKAELQSIVMESEKYRLTGGVTRSWASLFQCMGSQWWKVTQRPILSPDPRQKSTISGSVLTGAVLASSQRLVTLSQKSGLVHYFPVLLEVFQVAKQNLPRCNLAESITLCLIHNKLFPLCSLYIWKPSFYPTLSFPSL